MDAVVVRVTVTQLPREVIKLAATIVGGAAKSYKRKLANVGSVFCTISKTLRAATRVRRPVVDNYRDANKSCYDMYGTTIADWHNSTGIPSFRHSAQCSDVLLSISSGGYDVSSLKAFAFHLDD
eukprot:m51a1_g13270 hypothetical protein (124) ;mRNA; f:548-1046